MRRSTRLKVIGDWSRDLRQNLRQVDGKFTVFWCQWSHHCFAQGTNEPRTLNRITPGKISYSNQTYISVAMTAQLWVNPELWREMSWNNILQQTYIVFSRDCNTGILNPRILAVLILNPRILAVFAKPESWDWRRLNPRISGLQKLAKIVLFRMLNDINNNFSHLVNKIFYERWSNTSCCRCKFVFWHCHSLQFRYTFQGPYA